MADSCPAFFVVVDIPDIIIADVCPAGMISIGAIDSCLISTASVKCVIYDRGVDIVNGKSYTDSGVLYAVSRTELKMCWQRNASARDFKECVHNVLGVRISK